MKKIQEEMLVTVDENDKILGFRTWVDIKQDKSLICQIAAVIVLNNKGEILLQKRSKRKHIYPGFYTLSATGHVSQGEIYEETARRELSEELGIVTKLKFISKKLIKSEITREMVSYYKTFYNGHFQINHEEIDSVSFFSLHELKEIIKSDKIKLTPCAKAGIELL